MSDTVSSLTIPFSETALRASPPAARRRVASVTTEPWWVQALLILGALGFLLSFLLLPLLLVFVEALRGGVSVFWRAISDPDALAAALTAWRFQQGRATPLGDAREGLIWLPVPRAEVRATYTAV